MSARSYFNFFNWTPDEPPVSRMQSYLIMKNKRLFLLASFAILMLSGCIVSENPYTALPPGPWRAVLTLDPAAAAASKAGSASEIQDGTFSEIVEGELPFNFEVIYDNETDFHIEIINGKERIRVDDITIGRNKRIAKDTIRIEFPVFDSYIHGIFYENIIEGEWVVNYREDYQIPFIAKSGLAHRFTKLKKEPVMDISGRWETTFEVGTEDEYKGVGEFVQDGNHLTGTFQTETGDYRFLEGTVQGDKLYLSTFDGSHAYLFEGKIQPDRTIFGSWLSGKHYQTTWQARANPDFELQDPNTLTFLKNNTERFDFAFENPAGETISLDDPRYEGKVKIVQIMGTWCPNCRDETEFLLDYLEKKPSDDLAVIGLAFERYRDRDRSMQAIRKYRGVFGMDYEILLAGTSSSKAEAAEALPMLNTFISFPTMIFLDRQNNVRRIHTGFYGPATSEFEPFRQEFHRFVKELLAEEM